MPKRTDIKKILIIGAGPIVIGQACEFDYSGTQACKALREEGFEVVLVNSNPATIMTDPDMADRTYIEPITPAVVERIIAKERPDAVLPTLGGQTGLNVGLALAESGVLEKYGCQLIGATAEAIRKAEDRALFKTAWPRSAWPSARSGMAHSLDEARKVRDEMGLPCVLRPSFTMGGSGGGIAYNRDEFDRMVAFGLELSPSTRSWSRSASSAGKSTRWRSCATAPTTPSSSAPSRTSTRWASTPATASPSPRRRRSPTRNTS